MVPRRLLASLLVSGLVLLASIRALATGPQGTIKHVIVVVQENRTPDNLFHLDSTPVSRGADVIPLATPQCKKPNQAAFEVPLVSAPLDACFDPNHSHGAWKATWDSGAMDGACNLGVKYPFEPPPASCEITYPEYTYVSDADHNLDAYFKIAENYGFSNYFFQTNQGPSFPAHQFLFGGTSAPICCGDSQNLYQWFAAENPVIPQQPGAGENTGCTAPPTEYSTLIDTGKQEGSCPNPNDLHCAYTCYDHKTMANVLNPLSRGQTDPQNWLYYVSLINHGSTSIWTAPNAILSICGLHPNGQCDNTDDWKRVVTGKTRNGDHAAILTDIESCQLPKVAWVVPDGHWSDHPGHSIAQGDGPHDGGPSWVAAIINDVIDASTCDSGAGYWSDTVIFVVWDDWGGFYDHVPPYRCTQQLGCIGYPDPTQDGSQYVYGFRVPMLVVGGYVTPGYISGTPSQGGEVQPYIHDFGSILGFIEYTFGTNEIEANYHFADHWSPDSLGGGCSQAVCPYPLADFFNFSQFHNPVRITPTKYDKSCFHDGSCFAANFVEADPDDDSIDEQN